MCVFAPSKHANKTKYRSELSAASDTRIRLSNIEQKFHWKKKNPLFSLSIATIVLHDLQNIHK